MATRPAQSIPDLPSATKEKAKELDWETINADRQAAVEEIVRPSGFGEHDAKRLRSILSVTLNAYNRKREEDTLWKECEGKQVLNQIARDAGFANTTTLIRASFAIWDRGGSAPPQELLEFREYVASL